MKLNQISGALLGAVIVGGFLLTKSKPVWSAPTEAFPFLATFRATENAHGFPQNLLVRIAWQESRFRPDIINGETVSSAGAVGIMQIVPRWHPDVNPYDPIESIEYAGEYLAGLRDRFGGDLQLALAAYNWGPGNVSRALATDLAFTEYPAETRSYIVSVSRDMNLTGRLV